MCDNAGGHANPTDEVEESKQFFELVQKFMAEYTASAKVRTIYLIFKEWKRNNLCRIFQEFVTSTESTRRVQAWHEMIQPRLREAENRRAFDIHLYRSRILEGFGSKSYRKPMFFQQNCLRPTAKRSGPLFPRYSAISKFREKKLLNFRPVLKCIFINN